MSEPVQQGPGEPLRAKDLGPFLEGQIRGQHEAAILRGPGDDPKEHFGFWLEKFDTHTFIVLGRHLYCLTPARFRFW